MNKYQLAEYAELLFSAAVYKTENITDAEDLVQDTLIAALAAIEQKKDISDPVRNLRRWQIIADTVH